MKEFSDKLRPENRKQFSEFRNNRELCKLRQRIVDYLYSENTNGFDLKTNHGSEQYDYTTTNKNLIDIIQKELQTLGWNTILAYGGTTLFIYKEKSELPLMSDMDEIDC